MNYGDSLVVCFCLFVFVFVFATMRREDNAIKERWRGSLVEEQLASSHFLKCKSKYLLSDLWMQLTEMERVGQRKECPTEDRRQGVNELSASQ